MGLFGGFKAKFTKDSTAKIPKSAKKDEVVCLGYRVYSEFDNPPKYLQTSPESSKQPPAIKTVKPRPNRGESNAPQPSASAQTVTIPKVNKTSKKKASETGNKHLSATSVTLTNNISQEQSNTASLNQINSISNPNLTLITTEPVNLRNGGLKEESRSAPNSVYVTGKTSSFNPNHNNNSSSNVIDNSTKGVVKEVQPKATKSILKSKPSVYNEELRTHTSQVSNTIYNPDNNTIVTSDENVYSDNEYDRTVTLASSKVSKAKGSRLKTVDYVSASQAVTKSSSTQVATYVHTEVSSSKSDATIKANDNSTSYYSGGYSSYNPTSSIGNTSNHAASIFFGGDEEPEVQRPRRANQADTQSEEEKRSSAEC